MAGVVLALFLVICPFRSFASDGGGVVEETHEKEELSGRYQFRASLHGRKFFFGEDGLGVAGWGIIPDLVTIRENPSGLILFGLVYEKDRSNIEFLSGVSTNRHRGEPVFDLRATHEVGRWEGHFIGTYLTRSEEVELEPELTYKTPWHFRFGAEIEIGRNGDWAWSMGPKLIIPIPFLAGSSLRATYQLGPEKKFLRTEVWFEF